MKTIIWEKSQQLDTHITEKVSDVLSKTRCRTSKTVKFWKHIGQILRERIPVLSPLQELINGKWFISDIHIVKYSASRWGRVIIVCTEWTFAYILIIYGSDIIKEAQYNITNILFHQQFPRHISIETVILMIIMSLGSIGYYGMIKPWDFKQAIKEHLEEYK